MASKPPTLRLWRFLFASLSTHQISQISGIILPLKFLYIRSDSRTHLRIPYLYLCNMPHLCLLCQYVYHNYLYIIYVAEHFDVDALQRLLEARCKDDPMDFPTSLRQLTNDVHRHTWFVQRGTSFGHDRITATLRGTRPGSPVADIGFNLLMSDILQELEDRLKADEVISGAGRDFPVQLLPVTWVDDLAVPVATSSPGDLETVIKAVLQHIHETFYSRGLQINYDKGKTEVVVMHRGADADQCRRRFFTIDAETYITTSTSSHVFRVRAVPSYKHLGIRFQMDADLEHEISCRSAMARTAFHEIRRQIFRNQSLSTSTRITLLHSLVFAKLFYGCGSWYEIPRRVAARLDGLMIRFYRSVVNKGFWNDSHATDEDLRAQHTLPTFRVYLAMARLRFFQHVATHDHEFHRCLLLGERWLKRSMKMHFLREGMANECKQFHNEAITIMKDYGATLHEPVAPDDGHTSHACPECHQLFSTSTGVAVHRAKKHGISAQIPAFVQSAVCPGCLKFMWTTARVIQHLRYQPNRCLDRSLHLDLRKNTSLWDSRNIYDGSSGCLLRDNIMDLSYLYLMKKKEFACESVFVPARNMVPIMTIGVRSIRP